MAEDSKIEIAVEFPGTQQGVQGLTQVERSLDRVDTQADATQASTAQVNTNFAAMAQGGTQLAQRIQGVAGAAQGLVSALGSSDRTAGLVSSLAGAVAQGAAMGSMFGPAGALIGGIVAATAAMVGLAEANDRVAESAVRAAGGLVEAGRAARENAESAARENAMLTGSLLDHMTLQEIDDGIDGVRMRLRELRDERREAQLDRDVEAYRRISEEIGRLNTGLERMNELRGGVASLPAGVDMPSASFVATTPRRGGGGDSTDYGEEALRRLEAAEEEVADRHAELQEEMLDESRKRYEYEIELAEEAAERRRELMERDLDTQREVNEALADAERDYQDRLAEGRQAQKDAETELLERQQTEREESMSELMGLMQESTALLGDTIKSIATGEKTAEEAFKGLAAAFLEMISEYTSLKAATEFADAAASFARYDFGGGAAHVGAGLAFTAVAVATGIGAAAIGSAPQAPARPEAGQQATGGGGGGDVVVNWNSPVVTAGTRAELGREIAGMVGEAGAI